MEKEAKEEHFRRKERHYGPFLRALLHSSGVTEHKEITLTGGVRTVEVPTRAEAKPKQIKVNVAKTLKAASGGDWPLQPHGTFDWRHCISW